MNIKQPKTNNMNYILKLIEWFNGNKTIIGSFMISLALFIELKIIPKLSATPEWLSISLEILSYLGALLGGTGLIHKIMKGGQIKREIIGTVGPPPTKP